MLQLWHTVLEMSRGYSRNDEGSPVRRTPSTKIEDRLVAAAFHLLEAEGPEALSVRRVAAEAGVAPMGVYNHFEGGKNGVVDAIFRRRLRHPHRRSSPT